MTHGLRRLPLLAGCLGCLLAVTSPAADDAGPDAAFLEFLGSWSDDDAGADWLDLLDGINGLDPELDPGAGTPATDADDGDALP